MTATRTVTPTTGTQERPQWRAVAGLLVPEALRNLLWATATMLLFLALGALVARWRGWELASTTWPGTVGVEVTADADGVLLVVSPVFLVAGAVAAMALVNQVVLAARTRVLVASGATRRSVVLGLFSTLVVMTLYVLLVAAVVLVVAGRGLEGGMSLVLADDAGDLVLLALRAVGAVAVSLAAATGVVAVFLRWPWWVGTTVIVASFVLGPWLAAEVQVRGLLQAPLGWWGRDLVLAVVIGALTWFVMRRVPVR